MIRTALAATAMILASPLAAQPAPDGVGSDQMVMQHHGNEAASVPFLRGLALLHSFEYRRAASAFREAQEADPDWVMPYWGEAMTHNHPVWFRQDRDAAQEALAKLGGSPAERLAKARDAKEAAWLGAVELLFGDGDKEARDDAYLVRMQELLATYPDDIDVRAFTGLAMLGTSHEGRDIPTYMKAAAILEPGYAEYEHHPGLLHYLIHSYDDPVHAPLGLRAAERYAVVAPDAGHAQHMVSHIYNALGMWEEMEAANVNAMATVNRQRGARGLGEAFCGHYNEWLVYSLLQQGKDASRIVDGCRAEAIEGLADDNYGDSYSWADIALRQGVETGDWPEAIEGWGDDMYGPRYDIAYGRMLASRHDAEAAASAVAEMRALLETRLALSPQEGGFSDAEYANWAKRMMAQGEAVALLAAGNVDAGLAALEAAAAAEAALPVVFGPPMMPKPSYELLGDEYRALGRLEEARAAYTSSLAFAPGRRQTLAGLAALDN